MSNPRNLSTSWLGVLMVVTSFGLLPSTIHAAVAANETAPLAVLERGPHHRVIERTVTEKRPDGRTVERKSSYTELATGMHYRNEQGEWIESKEEIEIVQSAAVARQGIIQVIFAANLNSPGAIDLLAPDGQRFRSHVLGLVYTDYASGRSVMIAEVKDSIGAVLAPNQVIYQDAFDGDCVADVRYTYTKSGFEQDIILRTAPPSPAEWGLNPETTRLEVFTEFIEAPATQVTPVVLRREENPLARQQMAEPDLIDQHLNFGGMRMEQGHAFPMGVEKIDPFDDSTVPTGKSFERIDGRLFLIEKVDYPSVRKHLEQLPKSASINRARKVGLPEPGRTMMASLLPARPAGNPGAWPDSPQYAKVDAGRKGFVLDYVTLATASLTNFHFQAGVTYHITGSLDLYGTTVAEGLAVLKYNASTLIRIRGPLDCRTAAYRPLILTGKDDDTVGEIISGSTGSPGNAYASEMLYLYDTSITYELHDLHFSHAYRAITLFPNAKANISHLQVVKGRMAFGQNNGSTIYCRNFLFYDLNLNGTIISGTPTNRSEHGTFHFVNNFRSGTNAGLFTLTNSLVVVVTNNVVFDGANNVISATDTGFFETVGAAAHYLASGSTNRDAGTTNINPDLLAELKTKTTHPPLVYSNITLTTNLTLTLQSIRDTNAPDLGFHYAALDAVLGGVRVTNSTLTVSAGVAVGTFTPGQYGIGLVGGAQLVSEGTPTSLNRIVRYNMVQEQVTTNWNGHATDGASVMTKWQSSGATPDARFRFTEWSAPAGSYHFWGMSEDAGVHDFVDCQFHGGVFWSDRPSVNLTNSLFNRTYVALYEGYDFNVNARNCTFAGGLLEFLHVGAGTWLFEDNLFGTTNIVQDASPFTADFNAYLTNSTHLSPTGTHDLVLIVTNITYDTGRLGHFYLPTNLISHSPLFNSGSTNASAVGLYHYTTTTNQVKEGTSTNDLGFHYVALNSSGEPVDSDGDGLDDYIEDVDGDGVADAGESSYTNLDTDYDGRNDGQEHVDGTSLIDASSVMPVLLGRWRFDTDTWAGDQGQLPKSNTNLVSVPSWSTNAVLINSNTVSNLKYRDVETNALANINCRSGTVRFWFKPVWASTNQGGTGPGGFGHLLVLGSFTNNASYGYWSLAVNSDGTNLHFITQDAGVGTTNLTAGIGWASNEWHQIAATYGPSNTTLYLDGQPAVTNGLGIQKYPGDAVRSADGFSIGSNRLGTEQARGSFEELETYNYVLSASNILSGYQQVVDGDKDGDGIPDAFDANPNASSVGTAISIDRPRNGQVVR